MKKYAQFQICGLHFILERAEDGTHFQLCDEAFSGVPVSFSASGFEELVTKIEACIGLELTEAIRCHLLSEFGVESWRKNIFGGLPQAFVPCRNSNAACA